MYTINKRDGHTIVETMIYMILGIIVIGYALNSMTHISKGYVKSRTVMKMQKDGRDAVQVMARELANTGFKFYIQSIDLSVRDDFNNDGIYNDNSEDLKTVTFYRTRPSRSAITVTTNHDPNFGGSGTTSPVQFTMIPGSDEDLNWLRATYTGTYNDDGDRRNGFQVDSAASFYFWNEANNSVNPFQPTMSGVSFSDTLEFYRSRYNSTTTSLTYVERTTYFVDNMNLMRLNSVIEPDPTGDRWSDGTIVSEDTVLFLENVKALQFQFSKDGINWLSTNTELDKKRHEMKQIRIQLLVHSSRDFQERYNVSYTMADLYGGASFSSSNDDGALYRLYEKIVEIPNNGIISAN